jgi:hypothetical protein
MMGAEEDCDVERTSYGFKWSRRDDLLLFMTVVLPVTKDPGQLIVLEVERSSSSSDEEAEDEKGDDEDKKYEGEDEVDINGDSM